MTTDPPEPLTLRVRGMDCSEEIAMLKRALLPLVDDEERLRFDLLQGKLTIERSSRDVRQEEVLAAIQRTGLTAEPWQDVDEQTDRQSHWARHGRAWLTAISGTFALLGLAIQAWLTTAEELAGGQSILAVSFYLLGILAGMGRVVPKAWRAAIALRPDMNLLMSIAVTGAALIGEWFEAAMVAFLFSLSLLLESWSVGRARRAIASLLDLAEVITHVREAAGQLIDLPPSEVAVGTRFVVRPGERIPLDGRVVEGRSSVDQAPITGESMPVDKGIGDDVFAGAINGDGMLEVENSKPANDTTLARMICMVREAQSRRAPSEQWVEKFAAVYTPLVLALAAAVLLVPPLLLHEPWAPWVYRSLVLLVIACPCALVISTPVSIVASLTAAARQGVLIKGGVFVELPSRLKAIAIDKTGTLTRGRPEVREIVPLGEDDERQLLTLAAALELHSNHPLGRAVLAEATRRGLNPPEPQQYETIPGKGASGYLFGAWHWIGSQRYAQQRGQETPEVQEQLRRLQQAGHTVVAVGDDRRVRGLIVLADAIRKPAATAIEEMRAAGIEHLVMLTGDDPGTAQAIAQQAGIDEFRAELLPQDKVAVVADLVAEYRDVAMIGDGVNDAPAMAQASLGVAMGAAGSDAAIETCDVALMSDDLTRIPWLIRHSHRTLAVIGQNIRFALIVKGLFVLLTFAGYASLWMAIAADMGASLLVILNGLRLLRRTA